MQVMPKVIKDDDLDIYESSMNLYWYLLVFVMPIIVLGAGIYIFVRRRYR